MANLLVIDDDPAVPLLVRRTFQDSEVQVYSAGTAAAGLAELANNDIDVVVLDVLLPDLSGLETFDRVRQHDPKIPVIMITAGTTSDTAIEAMKRGAYEYLVKPLDLAQVRELVDRALELRRMINQPVAIPGDTIDAGAQTPQVDQLVGRCQAMQEVYKAVGRVASQDVTVLVRGESGTGKELVARAIYHHSHRAKGPFLAVNCAAIPEQLLESELFGHERGSFTGADRQRIGKFEQSNGGTLFLDEIGDMAPLLQSKILRLLQEHRFERVGGNETIHADVRVIAATNRDLEHMVENGAFREDLFYRLNGYTIKLPPLRERRDDLPMLIEHFLGRFGRELHKDVRGVSNEATELLLSYTWPGNIREMQNVLRQAILQMTGPVLVPEFLPEYVREAVVRLRSQGATPATEGERLPWAGLIDERLREGAVGLYDEVLASMERDLFTRVLRHTGGNQIQAARILGIARGTLRAKTRALGIRLENVVVAEEDADGAD
ncbi:MAG: sigma-54-dependent Fis family transcriptional regulator [Pirellulales bacterium]|nr:sigma-54-dependent Fis family transcriptional regulator [Pirellulales bacterium]